MFNLFFVLGALTLVIPKIGFLDKPVSELKTQANVVQGVLTSRVEESIWTWRTVFAVSFFGLALFFSLFHRTAEVA